MFLFLALALQEDLLVVRADPNRPACQAELEKYDAAEGLLEKDPAAALKSLNELLEKSRLQPETRVRIERRANDPDPPRLFLPYQLRGRVRLKLARAEGGAPADRRRLLHEAAADFEESARRRVAASETLAREARAELWSSFQSALAFGAVEAAAPDLGAQAGALLLKSEDVARDAPAWLAGEVGKAAAAVKALEKKPASREPALRIVGWCDAALAATKGNPRLKDAADAAFQVRGTALAVAEYKGAFRLKICVSPYAEVESVVRQGCEPERPGRFTPLVLPKTLEIGDYAVKLSHPRLGKRDAPFGADRLKDGATYVLSGDMETGRFTLTELP